MSGSTQLNFNHEQETISCNQCGMEFSAPSSWVGDRRRKHDTFYCPNGHSLHFPGKSAEEALREELAREKRFHEFTKNDRDAARRSAETNEARRRGEKAAKTRLKKRIAAGVCPCCNRTFQDLQAHMAGKHPAFVADDPRAGD